jgi:hypothetical protein
VVIRFRSNLLKSVMTDGDTLLAYLSIFMPNSGEVNCQFGVYANQCCGHEIIIREGATFPDCPNHKGLAVAWNQIEAEIVDLITLKKKSTVDPSA